MKRKSSTWHVDETFVRVGRRWMYLFRAVDSAGQAMINALVTGKKLSAKEIAELSKRRLRQRIPELTEALQGHNLDDHHRCLIEQSVEHAVLLDRQMEELEWIETNRQPYREQFELLQTIPGVKEMTAATILAEIGPDMSQFETAKHLCSWAGISPGNNRSAGKSKHSRIKRGSNSRWPRSSRHLGQRRANGTRCFNANFTGGAQTGPSQTNVALARCLLEVVYVLLKERQPYREPDPKAIHELEKAKLARHHTKSLRQLGADVALVNELVVRLNQPAGGSSVESSEKPTEASPPNRKVCPASSSPKQTTRPEADFREESIFETKDLHGSR